MPTASWGGSYRLTALRMRAFPREYQLVDGVEIGLGRGDDDVGVGAMAVDDAPAAFQTHRDLALRIGAAGDVVDGVQQQLPAAADDAVDGLERRIHRPTAVGAGLLFRTVDRERYRGVRRFASLGTNLERNQPVMLVLLFQIGLGDKRLYIFIEDFMLLVGEVLEALERGIQFLLGLEFDTKLFQPALKGVTPAVLAQHHAIRGPAHILGAHDFVGLAFLDDAILMDAGLVREGIGADNRLVRLHRKTGDARNHARGRHDLGGVDARVAAKKIAPRTHCHHDLLKRGVAGTLAEAVDGAFHLARAVQYRRQRVGDRQAEIVVTVR